MTSIAARLIARAKPIWPLIACTIGMMVFSGLGFLLMDYRWTAGRWLHWTGEVIIVSCMLSQIALATIVGGLITRHWLTGWLLAVMLACVQTVMATIISEYPFLKSQSALQHLALCSMWPAFMLATCAPLVALRTLRGWTLRRQSQPAIPRWRSSLEDLILFGVVLACAMTTSQVFSYFEGPQNVPQLILIMAIFAATSLICIPPVVYVTFRSRSWTRRLIGWSVLTVIAFAVVFVEAIILDSGGFWNTVNAIPEMIVGMLTTSITMAVGLISLMASGYQLTHFERVHKNPSPAASDTGAAPVVDQADTSASSEAKPPFEAEWLDDAQPEIFAHAFELTPQSQARLIALGLIAVAAIGAMGIHFSKLRRLHFYEEVNQLNVERVYASQQQITGLKFPADFGDNDLQQYLKYRDTITSLSFAGTQITDAILPELKSFSRLRELDLSGTAITDAGIRQLRLPSPSTPDAEGRVGFQRLSLADTKVSMTGLREFLQGNMTTYAHLDLSGLQINDADLATRLPTFSLKLSRNPITDAGLSVLLQNSSLHGLDVSDTPITGSTLIVPECPQQLNLDGTAINDATLTAILKNVNVSHFSLRRTGVTAAMLPLLVNKSLRLGQGTITELDLMSLGAASFQHLGLNDKQFTGKCLTTGLITLRSLDLSNSAVTDDVLIALGSKGIWYQFLGLANTQVTDASMPLLWSISEIDIRGTRVTSSALGPRSASGYIIWHNQFTPKELSSLNSPVVEFSERPRASLWPE